MVAIIILALIVIWGGLRMLRTHHGEQRTAAGPALAIAPTAPAPEGVPASAPTPAAQPAASAPVHAPAAGPATSATTGSASSDVVHAELPIIAHSAGESIHGHFEVVVRVIVNRSGAVIDESFDDTGPSRYFARQSAVAARQWRFAPTDQHSQRVWLLRFGYGRSEVTARAEPIASP